MTTYHRTALIKNMNLEFGELMTRINDRILSHLKENSSTDLEKITNWDLDCKEDTKCLEHVEKMTNNLHRVKDYLETKMRYKKMEHRALFTEELTEEDILNLGEEFSLSVRDDSPSKDIK